MCWINSQALAWCLGGGLTPLQAILFVFLLSSTMDFVHLLQKNKNKNPFNWLVFVGLALLRSEREAMKQL
jgi:hypothetical protein